ncbi:MAG: hypothetical protein Q8O57_07150 [Kiritimatiellota bacterium]|nr:hypothetical protein [Kiritimatiellota bacterium]
MDNVSDGMQSLCESVITGYRARKIALAFVKDESNTIRGDARLFIGQCRILQRCHANALRKELAEYRKAMVPAVHVFLQTCRHRRTETRSDLLGASRAWRAMATELKQRRGQKSWLRPKTAL